ncbi:MAG TPA: hypothetical protein VFB99_17320 [Vicinamibacterales bacterium]|nr:hypothetical protein [Vicinamibacterales bacterium]
MSERLPSETTCGECGACVPLDPRDWKVEPELGGANQICRCPRCNAVVFGIVGTPEYLRQVSIEASLFIALHRGELLH